MKRIVFFAKEEVKKALRDEAHRRSKTQMEVMTTLIKDNCKTDEEFLRNRRKKTNAS